MVADSPPRPADTPLAREVGRWQLLALTINCVVGAGILGLPGKVFALAGDETIGVLVAAALLATAAAMCLAELGSRFDGVGGPVEYCRVALGAEAGFVVGWLSWSATVLAAASLLNLLSDLLLPLPRLAVLLLGGIGLTGLTLAGVGRSATASGGLAIAKVLLLGGIAAAGLLLYSTPAMPPATAPQPASALVLLFFAFVGFERPSAIAGEVSGARAAVPFALMLGMACVALLYIGLVTACLNGVPDLATSMRPVSELTERLVGVRGAGAVNAAAALIVLGTLVSQWITAPRVLLALALDAQLPGPLAHISARRRTPDMAIIVTGAIATLLALGGDFLGSVAASSASRLLIFMACGIALLRLRAKDDGRRPSFRLPAGRLIATGVIIACAVLLVMVAAELIRLFALLAIGGMLWLVTRRARR